MEKQKASEFITEGDIVFHILGPGVEDRIENKIKELLGEETAFRAQHSCC